MDKENKGLCVLNLANWLGVGKMAMHSHTEVGSEGYWVGLLVLVLVLTFIREHN